MEDDRARVVIVGGGVAGTSIAYHLTKLGWNDVLLLDRSELTSGSTFHSAGLVAQLRNSVSHTRMMMDGVELYPELEAETGVDVGWHQVGTLHLASSPYRLEALARQAGWAKSFGLPVEIVSAAEALERFPLLDVSNVLGAQFVPTDGHLDPTGLTMAFAEGAKRGGARIRTGVRVVEIPVRDGRVTGVVTDQGSIEAEVVVNAAGIWAHELGRLAGVEIPVVPMEHQYLITRPIDGVTSSFPTLRDPDNLVYVREEVGGLVVGGYERNPDPWHVDTPIPPDFNHRLLEERWERFEPIAEGAFNLIPALRTTEINRFINGPEAFTPDDDFILGETEVRGFFVAAGFCAHGITGGAGVGRSTAEWIVDGEPSMDLSKMDVRRFGAHYRSRRYALARAHEIYAKHYDVKYPGEDYQAGRPLKVSPTYARLEALGAEFGEKAGWERANWFGSNEDPAFAALQPRGWAGEHWSTAIVAEHVATRERAGLFDESSFAKLEVSGPQACAFLQRICANDVDVAAGSGRLHADAQPARRHPVRPHGDPPVGRPLSDRHRHGIREPRPRVDRRAARRRRTGRGARRDLGPRVPRGVGPSRAGHPDLGLRGRPVERGLPVHDVPRDHGRRRPVPRAPGHLRGRARVGAVRAVGARGDAVGHPARGRRTARDRPGRLPRDRLAAAREGLPGVGLGRDPRRLAARGRARVRRRGGEGLRRQGGVRAPTRRGRRDGSSPAWSWRTRAPRRWATNRCAPAARSSRA